MFGDLDRPAAQILAIEQGVPLFIRGGVVAQRRDGYAGAHERQKPSCSHFYSSPHCSKPKYGEEHASFARSDRCLPCVADVGRWSIVPCQGAPATIGMLLRSRRRASPKARGHMARSSLHIAASLLMLSLCAYVPATHAQSGTLARIVVIQPKPGQAAAFEAGYQRHLEWHRKNADPWRWYGWTFVLGHRLGQFMDGTFGHTSADLDGAIKPAEDRADNAVNVTPYADF